MTEGGARVDEAGEDRAAVASGAVLVLRVPLDADQPAVRVSWYQPVRPSVPIETEALKIHALTGEELATAPMMPEVVELPGASLRGSVLVARAAWVEGAFLDRALAPLRERVPNGVVDTAMTTAVLLLVLATRLEAEWGGLRTRDLVDLSRRR